jgi:aminopeptidase
MKTTYHPSKKVLENYAHVLVNFALGSGKGIKKGEVVMINANEAAKPLYVELRRAVWKAGGHVISGYSPVNDEKHDLEKDFYLYSEEHQINFFPAKYMKGLIDQIDHTIFIISDTDKKALASVDPKKMMQRGVAMKPWMEWRNKKENAGKFTWTIGLYGTEAMAKEAKLSLKEYWNEIIQACFLNEKDPVKKWEKVYTELEAYRLRLNKLEIENLHVEGKDADLWVKIGEKRAWNGGSGRNIPSFELFTSPDWRGTNGWIKFNQPLYRYGNIITGVELEFKEGIVVKSKAKKNENLLKQMIATEGANKIGEFSMTDKRFSRITKFMAETLFDENIGGPFGNSHLALGMSYHDCYAGDPSKVSKSTWKKLGYNDSSVHTDIVTTTDRTITAYLKNGKEMVIYKNGQYCF